MICKPWIHSFSIRLTFSVHSSTRNSALGKRRSDISSIYLLSLLSSPQNGYDQVCKWAKCDIFQKKYLIVPINENYHWYLAIIYEPEHTLMGIDYDEPDGVKQTPKCNHSNVHGDWTNTFYRTYIFTFDSLGGKHAPVWKWLFSYLEMEARCKKVSTFWGKWMEWLQWYGHFFFSVTVLKPWHIGAVAAKFMWLWNLSPSFRPYLHEWSNEVC